jgi:hypothetical protein
MVQFMRILFFTAPENSFAGKPAPGVRRSMHRHAPERTVSHFLVQTLPRKTGNLYMISTGWQAKPGEVYQFLSGAP